MKSEDRRKMAQDTVQATENGEYTYNGKKIKLKIPETPEYIYDTKIKKNLNQEKWFLLKNNIVKIGVTDFIEEYALENPNKSITVLNFASAKNPGGRFLKGVIAQEECISYVSTLYKSQLKAVDFYYEYHRRQGNPLYSNKMIYSSDIQIFKKINSGKTLERPINCSIITSCAPNAGVARSSGISEEEIERAMRERIYKIISLIADKKPYCAILGAYGCGVFRNNRKFVLETFEEAINNIIPKNSIEIIFAII